MWTVVCQFRVQRAGSVLDRQGYDTIIAANQSMRQNVCYKFIKRQTEPLSLLRHNVFLGAKHLQPVNHAGDFLQVIRQRHFELSVHA